MLFLLEMMEKGTTPSAEDGGSKTILLMRVL